MGIAEEKGSLAFGCDADLLILNDDLEVQATFIGGDLAWARRDDDATLWAPATHT